ncbi:hypothetical protein WA026_012141 [Henosepilachna vigintioctopunctata]|uniref:Uncharacterized protein n=1 Tax=Henosepilachna vigintioctopunctata TaxID=420089 RepID=A0AAW1VD86_9CUCU
MKNIFPHGYSLSHHGPKRTRWKSTKTTVCVVSFISVLPSLILVASAEVADNNPVFYQLLSPENSTPVDEFQLKNCSWPCISPENSTFANYTNKTSLDTVEEPLADIILIGVLSIVLGLMILITVIGKFSRQSDKRLRRISWINY